MIAVDTAVGEGTLGGAEGRKSEYVVGKFLPAATVRNRDADLRDIEDLCHHTS